MANGVVYTRWGRYDCPGNGTELVYTGKNIDFVCIMYTVLIWIQS